MECMTRTLMTKRYGDGGRRFDCFVPFSYSAVEKQECVDSECEAALSLFSFLCPMTWLVRVGSSSQCQGCRCDIH